VATSLQNSQNSGSVTISNGGRTCAIASASWVGAAADARFGSGGKHVFRVAVDSVAAGGAFNFGLAGGSTVQGKTFAYDANVDAGTSSGSLWANGVNVWSGIGGVSAGDTYDFAVDFTAKLFWVSKNGGAWNGSGTANPATGTGGFSFSNITDAYVSPYCAAVGTITYTFNFGTVAIPGFTAPSGFYGSDWSRQVYTAASQSAPASWTACNWVEAIGAGSSGAAGSGTGTASTGNGGGGGAWAAKWGVTGITAGAAFTYQLGAANGAATTTGATTVGAGPSLRAAGAGATTTAGGTTANCIADVSFAGGAGVAGSTSTASGAGGGAAGRGKALAGAAFDYIGTGGAGAAGVGGSGNNGQVAGGAANTAGTAGTIYGTTGSGSGAGGPTANGAGLAGGNYGGGGSGGRRSGNSGGAGGGGLLVLYWYSAWPVAVPRYVGAAGRAARYLGARTDAQMYLGPNSLF